MYLYQISIMVFYMENWQKVRKELGRTPLVEGVVGGSEPGYSALYVEHYLFNSIERTVSGIARTGFVTQFGGARVREGEAGAWRSTNMASESLLVPANTPTHWHYSGTVDFAVFYFPDISEGVTERIRLLAKESGKLLQFADPLVSAGALQLVRELNKGPGGDERFMAKLAQVMLEQIYRVLTTPETGGFNPRHAHFYRLQNVLAYIRENLGDDLAVPILADRAGLSVAHFRRLFREAMGTPPHRYVLASRLEQARKLLATTTMPIAQIADACAFSSQSHFTACFRKTHASTPAEYRRHIQQQADSAKSELKTW